MSYGADVVDSSGARPATSTESSRARSRPTSGAGADKVRAGDQPARPRRRSASISRPAARPRRRGDRVKRREFITLVGGAAAAWPLAARAQQAERMRRIGMSCPQPWTIGNFRPGSGRFCRSWRYSGTSGRNVRIDTRWARANAAEVRRHAMEMGASAPKLSWPMAPRPWQGCCRRPAQCRSCSGRRRSGRRWPRRQPGAARRERTGVVFFEYGISAKWLELLKQLVPSVMRAADIR